MKIDIFSGFLGAGKTTLIKKMIAEAYRGEKLVLIENEFGEIGIDGGFLQDAGIYITEMNSGCICCSLVGDFGKALEQVIETYAPDRIIIEPSGVGKLSDVIAAVRKIKDHHIELGNIVAVADAGKVKVYMKNFGEFYNNQIETAKTIVLSRTDAISQEKLDLAVNLIKEHNANAVLVTTPWDSLTGAQLLEAMEGKDTLKDFLSETEREHHCCHGHHEHDHEHDGHCCCHEHHHEHDEHCGCHEHHHEHHHLEHDEHCCCHEHHHEHDEHCGCHEHHHEHHHHEHGEHCNCHEHHDHHADEVFTSWGVETTRKYTLCGIEDVLKQLDSGNFGTILRAKGIVAGEDGNWIHFDFVPGEWNVRTGIAGVTGKICVIGASVDEDAVAALFGV